jgi:hypothetical protein
MITIQIQLTPEEATTVLEQREKDTLQMSMQIIGQNTHTLLCQKVANSIVEFIRINNPGMANAIEKQIDRNIWREIAVGEREDA